jgi:TonB family protein
MYLNIPEEKKFFLNIFNTFNLAIIISVILHLLFLIYIFKDFNDTVVDYNEVTIDQVEFLEKAKAIKIKKPDAPKPILKEINNFIKQKEDTKNINVDKFIQEQPAFEVKSTKIELPDIQVATKPKDLPSDLEIKQERFQNIKNTKNTKNIQIQDIPAEPVLKDKNKAIGNSKDLKTLINLDEVGDKKVSVKALDLATKLTKEIKVPSFQDKPQLDLKDKKEIGNNAISRQKKIEYIEDRPIKIIQQDLKELKVNKELKKEIKIDKETPPVNKNIQQKDLLNSESSSKNKKKFEITGKIKDRKIVNYIMPIYPDWAQERGIEALIKIYFEVDTTGNVLNYSIRIEVTSGYKKLDDLVIEVLKKWRFAPIDKDEIQGGIISFNFKLS